MKTLTWQKPGQQNVAQELIKIIINYVAELRLNVTMRTFRLLAASLLVALSMGVSSCGDDVTNEIIQQEPDNTLELLLGTWQGTGEAEGETLTFNKDDTYTEISENETLNGTFEYFPNRYMFVTYYTTDWGEENTIYTVVKITEKELYLNDNGHSDIVIYKRK